MKITHQLTRLSLTGAAVLFAAALAGCGGSAGSGSGSNTADDVEADGEGGGDEASPGGGSDVAEVGSAAPEVSGDHVTGDGPKNLAEGKGQIIIVDFWATYCDPCRKSFPKYQEIVDKHAGDVQVIAVSVDDPEDASLEDVKKFADDLGVSFPVIWDKDQSTAGKYKPPKMPTSYVIDKEGVLRHVHAGFEGGEADEIDKEVEALK